MTTKTVEIDHGAENAKGWLASIEDYTERLERADEGDKVGYAAVEAVREEIQESVLSVQVRGGWYSPGGNGDNGKPEEYEILLTTGGPALRIIGRLDQYCQPESAELQTQDWGTPWTRYPAPEAALLAFAQCFWFGE